MSLESLRIFVSPAIEMFKAKFGTQNSDRLCFGLLVCVSVGAFGWMYLKSWRVGDWKLYQRVVTKNNTSTSSSHPNISSVYDPEINKASTRIGRIDTPTPGPAFGHVLEQSPMSNRKPIYPLAVRADGIRTGRPLAPGYQTPFVKQSGIAHGSPDYSKLMQTAPTAFQQLVRNGTLNEDATPTRKRLDYERNMRRQNEIKAGETKVERRLFA
ncbi:hypothetical protein K491DRAFT_675005 [Lophiostoma macrostomum CBS 122681]|uniref:Uncharacterized protein n=1 Tax=Lophiostoma macrostomum CBS 122681 TaxID=1314788 RepID=A0A6A6TLB3_9PLEO|nr:hypothetical protein K491DRAFT_675005 [Lophiostoma macrostomum CBS 122681]